MFIKLDTLDFTFQDIHRTKSTSVGKKPKVLTKSDWVKLDRVVMVLMFVLAIVGSLVF